MIKFSSFVYCCDCRSSVKITFKKCKGSSVIPKRRFSKSLTTSFAIAYRKQVS